MLRCCGLLSHPCTLSFKVVDVTLRLPVQWGRTRVLSCVRYVVHNRNLDLTPCCRLLSHHSERPDHSALHWMQWNTVTVHAQPPQLPMSFLVHFSRAVGMLLGGARARAHGNAIHRDRQCGFKNWGVMDGHDNSSGDSDTHSYTASSK